MLEYWRIDDTESTVPFALAINQPFVMVSDRGLSQERSYQLARFLADMLNAFKQQAPPDMQVLPGGKATPGQIPGNPMPNPVVIKDSSTEGPTEHETTVISEYLLRKEEAKNAVQSDTIPKDLEKSDEPATASDKESIQDNSDSK